VVMTRRSSAGRPTSVMKTIGVVLGSGGVPTAPVLPLPPPFSFSSLLLAWHGTGEATKWRAGWLGGLGRRVSAYIATLGYGEHGERRMKVEGHM
jgi:hypothetical protein